MPYPTGLLSFPVSVGPTTTTFSGIDVISTRLVVMSVKNLDGTQTLDCTVSSRSHREIGWALSGILGLSGIGPGETKQTVVDCRGCRVVG